MIKSSFVLSTPKPHAPKYPVLRRHKSGVAMIVLFTSETEGTIVQSEEENGICAVGTHRLFGPHNWEDFIGTVSLTQE